MKPLDSIAAWLRCLLGASAVLALATCATSAAAFVLVLDAEDTPFGVRFAGQDAMADRLLAVSVAYGVIYIAAAVLFLVWEVRARKNLRGAGVVPPRWPGRFAGILAWVLPVVSLYAPRQVLEDVWRGSDPASRSEHGDWTEPVPRVFHFWWATWLLGGGVTFAVQWAGRSSADVANLRIVMVLIGCSAILYFVAALLAMRVVTLITSRHEEWITRPVSPPLQSTPPPVPAVAGVRRWYRELDE